MISLNHISKNFKIYKRNKGFWGAIKGLFKREVVLKKALDDVSFEIGQGEIVGYLGPNGAGKSTTIKIMCGILTPTSGECVVDGFVPWKQREKYVNNIGVVFGQRSQLWWDVPVIDSFFLLKDIYKIRDEDFKSRLDLLVEKLNLSDIINIPLRQLSLGQKMKCELVGSLLHNPKILFLDEPTIGLDAVAKLAVRDFIKEINKTLGVTVILTTHDMNDIEALTNRIILIGKGKILYDGSFEEIKEKHKKEKTIIVEYEDEFEDVEVDGYQFVSKVGKEVTYISTGKLFNLQKFISEVGKKHSIVDINVESMNVEEIISKLYEEYQI